MGNLIEKIKKNKLLVIIIGVVILVVGAVAMLSGLDNEADNLSAFEIISLMKEDDNINKMITDDKEIIDTNDDSLEMLGKDNHYIYKVKFADSTDQFVTDDNKYPSGAIEVFKNKKDLKIREEYLKYHIEQFNSIYPTKEYGEILNLIGINQSGCYIYQNGNALLIISANIDKKAAAKYKQSFDKVLENKTYDQRDVPDKKLIDKIINDDKKEIEKNIKESNELIEVMLETAYENVDKTLAEVAQSRSETDLNELKETVEYFNAPHYQEKYGQWITKIGAVEQQIAEKKAAEEAEAATKKAAEEAEKLRKETLQNNRHSAGMYKVGTDIPAGEYVLVGDGYFRIDKDSSGDFSSIVANDNFSGNSIITVSAGQYLTVERAVFYDINLNPDVNTSGEGMFKVGLHIPAGEYKLVSTGSLSGYYAIRSDSSHSFKSIKSNDNFTGEKYITVKNGQYLTLSRCKISQ